MKYVLIYTYTDGEQHRYNYDDAKFLVKKITELLNSEIDVKIKIKSTIK